MSKHLLFNESLDQIYQTCVYFLIYLHVVWRNHALDYFLRKCTQQQTNHNSSSLEDDLPYILVERNFGEFSQICTNRTKCVNGNSVYTNCAHIGLLQNLNVVLQDSVMQCLSRPCIHFRIGVTYIYRPDCPCMCCIKCQHKSKHELVRDAVNW